jgi:hypothetical protein
MSCDLIIINQKIDISFLKNFVNERTKILCLQPSFAVELEESGIKYENSVHFFGAEGHKSTLLFSTEVVEKIRPFLKHLSHGKFCRTFEKNWIFKFRFYLHSWISILHIIHLAVDKYQPGRLVILGSNVNELSPKHYHNDSLLRVIVKHYSEAHGIKTHFVNNTRRFTLMKWKGLLLLKHYFKILIFEICLLIYPLLNRNKSAVLVPEDSYNMPRFMNEVSQHIEGSLPVYLQSRRESLSNTLKEMIKGNLFSFMFIPTGFSFYKKNIFQDQLNSSKENILNWLSDSSSNTSIHGVDLCQPLSRFINYELTEEMKELYGKLSSLHRVLNIVKPKYVFAQHSLGISYALGEYCATNSIPSLLISHGSHTPHSETIAELEWSVHAQTIINTDYPFVALQTPWASQFLQEQKDVVSRGIKTGPLLFSRNSVRAKANYRSKDHLFKEHKGRKVVLHASTPRDWKNLRPWVYETTDEYIRNVNDIIKAVEVNKNLYLAIRFRPMQYLNLSEFRSLLIPSNCYDVYTEGSFEEYLLSSDLLISYSSTTIEESLQNHTPVLQYDPDGKYIHIPGHKLSEKGGEYISSVYYVDSQNCLSESLKWWDINHDNTKVNDWSKHIIDSDSNMTWIDSL